MESVKKAAVSHWKWIVPLCVVGVVIWGPFGLMLGALGPVVGKLVSKRKDAESPGTESTSKIDGPFSGALFEVLEQNSSVYSTTQISGGGGYVTGSHTGGTYGHVDPVQSTSTIHRESQIWLKNFYTGQEARVSLPGNVAARAGHKLVFIWAEPKPTLERVVNLSTNAVHCVGELSPSKDESTSSLVLGAAGNAFFFAVPILNGLYMVAILWERLIQGRGMTIEEKNVPGIRKFAAIVIALAAFVLFAVARWRPRGDADVPYWFLPPILSVFVFTAALLQLLKERRIIRSNLTALEQYTTKFAQDVRAQLASNPPSTTR